jgi:hypothetical protein
MNKLKKILVWAGVGVGIGFISDIMLAIITRVKGARQ